MHVFSSILLHMVVAGLLLLPLHVSGHLFLSCVRALELLRCDAEACVYYVVMLCARMCATFVHAPVHRKKKLVQSIERAMCRVELRGPFSRLELRGPCVHRLTL
jgi:hypothetical protein